MKHLMLAAIFLIASDAWAQTPQTPTGTWGTETTSGPYSYYGGGCSDGSYIYYLGGYGYYNGGYNGNFRFNPLTNTWSTAGQLASMPTSVILMASASATYGGVTYVYSFGNGYNGNGAIYKYNTASNVWSTLSATLTNNRYMSAAAEVNGKIYIMGGTGSGGYSNLTDEFDPAYDTITPKANMPYAAYSIAAAGSSALGKVWVAGGYAGNYSQACHEYDVASNTWTTKTNMPGQRYGGVGFCLQNRFYHVNGYDPSVGYSNVTFEFAPGSNSWTTRATTPSSGYYGISSGVISGKGYVAGGYNMYYSTFEFTPPNFGTPPTFTNVTQTGSWGVTPQAGTDPDEGWTNDQIVFAADVNDVDAGQSVGIEVQVQGQGGAWGPVMSSGLKARSSGPINVQQIFDIPSDGTYDWRMRAFDAYFNYTPNVGGAPTWWEFNNNAVSPDFRSDQVPPAKTSGIYPSIDDVVVPSLISGDVTFQWGASTDNGPLHALRYSIEVAYNDPMFGTLYVTASDIVETSKTFTLETGRYDYYYRIGVTDIGGNFSGWGPIKQFRVVGDDGLNHGAGDAEKACGFAATAAGGPLFLMLAAAFAMLRRRK